MRVNVDPTNIDFEYFIRPTLLSVGEEILQFELSYFFARICIGLLLLVFLFLSLKDDPLLVSIKSAFFLLLPCSFVDGLDGSTATTIW